MQLQEVIYKYICFYAKRLPSSSICARIISGHSSHGVTGTNIQPITRGIIGLADVNPGSLVPKQRLRGEGGVDSGPHISTAHDDAFHVLEVIWDTKCTM